MKNGWPTTNDLSQKTGEIYATTGLLTNQESVLAWFDEVSRSQSFLRGYSILVRFKLIAITENMGASKTTCSGGSAPSRPKVHDRIRA